MSQAGINGNGSIAAIFTITTDSGTATPSGGNVNLYADTVVNSGTVQFTAAGNTIQWTPDIFGDGNMGIGTASMGNNITTGVNNVCLGTLTGTDITSGRDNTAVGTQAFAGLTTGSSSTAVGAAALSSLVSGSFNCALGEVAGQAYTGAESSNICIGFNTQGTLGESNTLRIGVATGAGNGELNRAFIQGIVGVTTTNTEGVTINTATGQLGSRSLTVLPNYSVVNATPYVVGASVYYMTVDTSTFAITIQLPDAPTQYRTFVIKDSAGNAAALNITVTTVSGLLNIDAAPTFIMNANYQSIQLVYSGFGYEVF